MRTYILTAAIVFVAACNAFAQPQEKSAAETAVNLQESNLPIVVIRVDQEIQEQERVQAHMGIIWKGGNATNYVSDPYNHYDGRIMIEYHGKSSLMFPKKSYRFETQYSNGENLNTRMLDMPEEDDWILYAPYSDKSLMRNYLTYTLAGEINDYAPRVRYCELIVNEEYEGVYVMTEKIEEDGDRVDIAALSQQDNSEPEITGGYLFRKDKMDEGDNLLWLETSGLNLIINEPKSDEITSAQEDWLTDYLNEFDQQLMNQGNYAEYIDVLSFVHNFLIVELAKNIDGYRLSTYFSKDRGEKIKAGPVWDYNLSFGNADYYEGWSPAGWYYTLPAGSEIDAIFWFEKLITDADFFNYSSQRWQSLRREQFSKHHILSMIDHWQQKLEAPAGRNFSRYHILGRYVWPNPGYPESGSQGSAAPTSGAPATWEGEVEFLKDFITQRLDWLDNQFGLQSLQALVEVAQPARGKVIHNNHVINERNYAEVFASDSVLSLHAVPAQGCRFKHWEKTMAADETEALIATASGWNYLDEGTAAAEGWTQASFDDSAWSSGEAQLGYGDGDEQTVVDYGSDPENKYVTTYFRHAFTLEDSLRFEELTARLLCDDGAVVYLNGHEIIRFNMPQGEITYDTYASDYLDGQQESAFRSFSIPDSLLKAGTNLLAAEIHQANSSSSDISFDFGLSGTLFTEDTAHVIGTAQKLDYKLKGDDTGIKAHFEEAPSDSAAPVINEFLASNDNGIRDDFFENEDWIELYNPLSEPVDIGGMFLSDNPAEPRKHRIPADLPEETTIAPKDYLILWADNDTLQGPLHLNFSLDKSSEAITLAQEINDTLRFIDLLSFHRQSTDVSMGRLPDGAEEWRLFVTTSPGETNRATQTPVEEPLAGNPAIGLKGNYPNPFNTSTTIRYRLPRRQHVKIAVYNKLGRKVKVLVNTTKSAGLHSLQWQTPDAAPGLYFYRMTSENHAETRKALIIK